MVSLGIGMRQAMIDSYAQMGSLTNITVMNWKYTDMGDGMGVILKAPPLKQALASQQMKSRYLGALIERFS